MKNNALNINSSVEWLNAGKILAHPTESIWGLGCDARNAIRVSNHLPIRQLFEMLSGFMVSTSANISGEENINNPNHIMNYFEYEEMAYYDEILGDNKSPSTIIDLESRAIIRE